MPAPKVKEWTPIRTRTGKLVHATSLVRPRQTLCGRSCDGGVIVPARLTCDDCKEKVRLPASRRRR